MLSQVLGFSIITPALYEKLIKTSQKLSNFSISYFISDFKINCLKSSLFDILRIL